MFVAPEDFRDRPHKVANQQNATDFGAFLEAQEDKALVDLLGYELKKLFLEAIAASELDGSDPDYVALPERYQELRDGADYTYNGKLYRYSGLVPFLKPYLYSLWLQQGSFNFTGSGFIQNLPPKGQGGDELSKLIEDQDEFRVKAWNDYVSLIGVRCSGDFKTVSPINSFYGFMISREDEWVNEDGDGVWEFTQPAFQNRLGF